MTLRGPLLVGLALLVVAALIASVVLSARWHRPANRLWTLHVELRASAGTVSELFWSADRQFTPEQSARASLEPALNGFQRVRFMLPSQGVRWLRFDPIDAAGDVTIRRMQLVDAHGRLLRDFPVEALTPVNQIASLRRDGDAVRLVTTPGATDPSVATAVGCLIPQTIEDRFSRVTPTVLAILTAAIVALLAACAVIVGRDVLSGTVTDRWLTAGWMAVLFLAILSGKLLLMRDNPVTVPFWDQWDGEARRLYVPFGECTLEWSRLFSLHNEHRIVASRILALDLLAVNGLWDPRLQQVVNAVLHAVTGLFLTAMLWIASGRRYLDLLVLVTAAAFALPFGWENTLIGFQSAFYFLLLFSILALWLTTRYDAGDGPWYVGWLCALCALFTAAGGVILPLPIAAIGILRFAQEYRRWRAAVATLVVASAVLTLGVLTASPPIAYHQSLNAHTVADFVGALGRNLAWPYIDYPGVSFIAWLPIVVLLIVIVRRPSCVTVRESFVAGLGVWVALQAAAMAYGRGAGAPAPASRYQDFLSVGLLANTVVLILTLERAPRGTSFHRAAVAALVTWIVVAGAGLDGLLNTTWRHLDTWRPYWTAHAANVHRYLIDGDLRAFALKRPLEELPYPDGVNLAGALQEPYIRSILPPTVRAPVHVEPRQITDNAFVPDGVDPTTPRDPLTRAWGSYTAGGNPVKGQFESQPLPPCQWGTHLRFEFAGYLAMRRQSFALKDVQSGRLTEIRPKELARESWLPVRVRCPSSAYVIVATDERSDYWFAFREPVESGRSSAWVEWLIRSSPRMLLLGVAMALICTRLRADRPSAPDARFSTPGVDTASAARVAVWPRIP